MRNPIPGLLPPGVGIRLTPAPPIAENEVPLLFSRGGNLAVSMTQDAGAVVLQNLTDKHTPYVLVVMERDAHTTMGYITERIRAYFSERKPTA